MSEYAHTLQNLWLDLDHYEQFNEAYKEDAALLKSYEEKDRIYKSLTLFIDHLYNKTKSLYHTDGRVTFFLFRTRA